MANDLNQCSFIGRLGKDPETRYLPNGDAVTNFSVAVGSKWKDKDSGEDRESVEWVRCVAWRKLGEICGQYLKKGTQVYVSGKLKTRKWQDQQGQDRYTTEVELDQMQMLGSKPASADGAEQREPEKREPEKKPETATAGATKRPAGKFDDLEDDIPF